MAMITYMVRVYPIPPEALESALRVAKPERWEVLMGTIAETWLEQGREEGKAEGLTEGLTKGRAEGLADSLSLLLERRFGPLPAGIRSRIGSAGSGQLRAWFETAMGADSLASVFGRGAMD